MEKPPAQYDKIAEAYKQNKEQFFSKERDFGAAFILENTADIRGVLLDIGCGAGDNTAEYERLPGRLVIGIDPSVAMVEKAKATVAHPENMHTGSFESTGAENESVDCVTGRFSLHYVPNLDDAYRELARVLKKGGKLVQVVSHPTADAAEPERFEKDGRIYVRIALYNGSVVIEFPLHTIEEYFSSAFNEYFELEKREDFTGKDRAYQEGPNTLAFVAVRK